MPYGEVHMARNLDWPLTNSQWETEVLSPIAFKEVNPANNLEADSPPVKPLDETMAVTNLLIEAFVKSPNLEVPAKPRPGSLPTETMT